MHKDVQVPRSTGMYESGHPLRHTVSSPAGVYAWVYQ